MKPFGKNPLAFIAILAITSTLFLTSCEDEVFFKNPIKGKAVPELAGLYEIRVDLGDDTGIHTDTVAFQLLEDGRFRVGKPGEDKDCFKGTIIRKRSLYFINKQDESNDYWKINAFRIEGDTAYNFLGAFMDFSDQSVLDYGKFKHVRKKEHKNDKGDVESTSYYINNRRRETYKAFSSMLEASYPVYFRKIDDIQESKPDQIEKEPTEHLASLESSAGNQWSVYPNPFDSELNIAKDFPGTTKVRMYNTNGKLVYDFDLSQRQETFSLPDLPKGMYVLELLSQDQNKLKKEVLKLVKN